MATQGALWAVSALVWLMAGSPDTIMGSYEGITTGDSPPSMVRRIDVVPRGGDRYDGVFGMLIDKEPETFRVPMRRINKRGVVVIYGEVPLDEEQGKINMSLRFDGDKASGVYGNRAGRYNFTARKIEQQSPTLGAPAPPDAVVLFDGTNLDAWQRLDGKPAHWQIVDGVLLVGPADDEGKAVRGNLISKQPFADAKVHVEFRTPFMPEQEGQQRGNSGVYLQGRYEVQVLDSFGEPPRDNEAGGIYKVAIPNVNASYVPGVWQTYDILFHAPKADQAGNLLKPGEITVHHNGTLIHDKVTLTKPTVGAAFDSVGEGGLMLQDHGNPVEYRNIWIVPIGTR